MDIVFHMKGDAIWHPRRRCFLIICNWIQNVTERQNIGTHSLSRKQFHAKLYPIFPVVCFACATKFYMCPSHWTEWFTWNCSKFLFGRCVYMHEIPAVRQIEKELSMQNCCWWQQCSHASFIVWPKHVQCWVPRKRWRSNELAKSFLFVQPRT